MCALAVWREISAHKWRILNHTLCVPHLNFCSYSLSRSSLACVINMMLAWKKRFAIRISGDIKRRFAYFFRVNERSTTSLSAATNAHNIHPLDFIRPSSTVLSLLKMELNSCGGETWSWVKFSQWIPPRITIVSFKCFIKVCKVHLRLLRQSTKIPPRAKSAIGERVTCPRAREKANNEKHWNWQ